MNGDIIAQANDSRIFQALIMNIIIILSMIVWIFLNHKRGKVYNNECYMNSVAIMIAACTETVIIASIS